MTPRAGGRNKEGTPEHDRGYRRLFSHPESIEELLRGFVEEDWVRGLDFSSLEKMDHHFVGDDFGGRASDIIWKMRFRNGKPAGEIYPYLLLELQSTSYHFMPVRVLTYSGLLLEQVIRTEKLKAGDLLPAILPVVLNSGRKSWRGPLSLATLFPGSRPLRLRKRCRAWLGTSTRFSPGRRTRSCDAVTTSGSAPSCGGPTKAL